MENNVRFRNHISIIVERMGSMLILLFVMFLGGVTRNMKEFVTGAQGLLSNMDIILKPLLIIIAILISLVIWQVVVWSKTYISIQDNTIVIERNTLNQRKNTIGIKNISNVNTEQNLFEMLIGTCKVKLDTNSLSTADKTDVKIVLKKADAEKFRLQIMRLMQKEKPDLYEENIGDTITYDVEADLGDMVIHGLFSINLFSLLVVMGTIVGVVEMLSRTFGAGITEKSIMGIITSLMVGAAFFFSAMWDIMKGFIVYYGFKAKRSGDKIYLKYGLFKKVNYAIPVDKINAVKLTQSLSARVGGRYMAEIINVGMGDDENEKQAFLVLYCKKKQMTEKLAILLPEFENILEQSVIRQPRSAWAAGTLSALVYLLVITASLAITATFFPTVWWPVVGVVTGITAFAILLCVCRYFTAGSLIESQYLKVANGYFRKTLICVKYNKIQYMQTEQNFLAKKFGILKGDVFLLASALHRAQPLPYFPEKDVNELKNMILKKRAFL